MYGRILDSLKAASLDIKAIEIYRGGETVYHYDIGEGKRYPVYSVTKSITSAAFSLACADGLLTADMPLAELLSKRYISKTNDNFRILPIKRFLTMAAGEYPFRPYGGDWIETILSLDTNYSDTSFHYSNIPAYLVGAAVENAVGKPLIQYLDRRLFSPLGIPTPEFANSPEGYFYGASLNSHRNVMPNYLLQWTNIQWAISLGCDIYDFRGVSGIVDENNGLYRFKKGFSGDMLEFMGEADLTVDAKGKKTVEAAQKIAKLLRR